ncbi:MAG: ABC transporter permease [Lachnospiraceae bacterium]|nr:ABC transporter permease [Lachnospiraceae bacterium]
MYILKNSFRSIGRSAGRNVLIAIIIIVIAASACIGLSIREAAEKARSESEENLSITAELYLDVKSMMSGSEDGSFDRSGFHEKMGNVSDLSLEELKIYATADAVKEFYYQSQIHLNAGEGIEPVSDSDGTENSTGSGIDPMNPSAEKISRKMGNSTDFTLVGYSSESAMENFQNGTAAVTSGIVFEEGTSEFDCLIPDELAVYNNLEAGDEITLLNPSNEEESYTFKIVGTYYDASGDAGFGGGDFVNRILVSAAVCSSISSQSEENAVIVTDEETGEETSSALTESITGTYTFADVDSYEAFENQARALGLAQEYSVSSSDAAAYEESLIPLENLSKFAWYFLVIVLIIGAVILVVLNLFNIRERKYEVGVLTAIGMKKWKVALQFVIEAFLITILAIVIGGGAGAAASVPVTNSLLESQVQAQESSVEQMEMSFGRGGGMRGIGHTAEEVDYISQVTSAADMVVLVQLAGIGILLTIFSSCVSVVFIMRYDPIRILADRD